MALIVPNFVTYQVWIESMQNGLAHVSDELFAQAASEISDADLIITAGNGGSASLASHMAQAIMKPDYKAGRGKAAVCLTDHVPILTAHANDGGWEGALLESARPYFGLCPVVVLFSSSGKSQNICRLASEARKSGLIVIAFTGFGGDPLRSLADVALHVNYHDYEVVEPVHDAWIHRVQYHLREIDRVGR